MTGGSSGSDLPAKELRFAEALIGEVQEQLIDLIHYLGEEDSKPSILLISRAIEFFTS
jgi:hypothetical protein